MTAQTILKAILLECGLDDDAEVGGTDFQTQQIIEFMNAAGKDAAKRGEWSKLHRSLNVDPNILSADLPDDFQEMAESGSVRLIDATYKSVRVIVSPEQWDFLSARPSTQPYYHIRDGKLLLTVNTGGVAFTYISKNWVGDKEAITTNTDDPVIPHRLIERGAIWRWKRQKGLPYDDVLAEFEADLDADYKADRGA